VNWLSLAIALIKAGGMLANYLAERRLLKAGEAEAVSNLLKGQADAFRRAAKIRDDVARDLDAHPERVRDEDGFRRKD
jgi:threonine synthase